jgi:hypothetical protein
VVIRGAVIVVVAVCAACKIGFPPPDGSIPHVMAGRRHPPEEILVFAGHPSRPFAPITFVATCNGFTDPLETIREQAADAGADAIVELEMRATFSGRCASGLAVSFR